MSRPPTAMDEGLCAYRNALGAPGEGVHAWRIAEGVGSHGVANGVPNPPGFAGADVLMTAVAAGAITGVAVAAGFAENALMVYAVVLVVLVALGAALHWAFCVDTPLNSIVGLGRGGSKTSE